MVIADYILVSIALLWISAACVTDIKKREVANWLSFSLIAIALAIRAFAAVLAPQPSYFLYGLAGLAAFFALGNALYYTKIFAGGDAKLLIALGAAFATTPSFTHVSSMHIPFLLLFFINLLLFGSAYGIFYSIALAIKNKRAFIAEFKKLSMETKKLRFLFLLFVSLLFVMLLLAKLQGMLFLLAIVLIFPYLYIFVKAVENSCMIKLLSPEQLTEGDWLAGPVKIGKTVIRPKTEGLSIEEIKLIRKARKKVLVKQGMPFVPVFLIAAIASLFFGNIFATVASLLL